MYTQKAVWKVSCSSMMILTGIKVVGQPNLPLSTFDVFYMPQVNAQEAMAHIFSYFHPQVGPEAPPSPPHRQHPIELVPSSHSR